MRNRTKGICVMVWMVVACQTFVLGDLAVFSQGSDNSFVENYQGTEDTRLISGGLQHTAGGTALALNVGDSSTAPQLSRSLIRFDLTSMAASNIVINSATLTFTRQSGSVASTLELYAMENAYGAWTPGTTSTQVVSATWAEYQRGTGTPPASGVKWASGVWATGTGAPGGGTYGSNSVASVDWNGSDNKIAFSLPTSLIEEWIAGNNPGLLLRLANEGTNADNLMGVWASEASNAAQRPELSINYTVVPEPETIGLLITSAVALMVLRRRF